MVSSQPNWPDWWKWELDCSNPHLAKRMIDRSFSEVDLREMLEHASDFRADRTPGRFVVETAHAGRPWQVILEPDEVARILIVIAAFPLG